MKFTLHKNVYEVRGNSVYNFGQYGKRTEPKLCKESRGLHKLGTHWYTFEDVMKIAQGAKKESKTTAKRLICDLCDEKWESVQDESNHRYLSVIWSRKLGFSDTYVYGVILNYWYERKIKEHKESKL